MPKARFSGVFPVVPTIFRADGEIDLEGQLRAVDFMIDAGSDGLCILANYSEQFSLSDSEREMLTEKILNHVAGRVPTIVTTSHFSPRICAERSRHAQSAGAAMVMVMPPYHGATLRAGETAIRQFFQALSDAISIPIMIQDAPMSGTPLSPEFLADMARTIENVAYFKMETAGAATKLRTLISLGGKAIEGPWDGEEGITLMADLDAGATGSMTGGGYPDGFRQIIDPYFAGDRDTARQAYRRWLPLINHENRQCGLAAAKILMHAGGIIGSDALRAPLPPVPKASREELLELASELDALALRWAR